MTSSAQVIRPPNPLRMKVGSGFAGIDSDAIAKAEEAFKAMSSQFGQWLRDELSKLEAARTALRDQGPTPEALENLYLRAHDLKGLGGTYQYPLVTRLAGSMCRLLDDKANRASAPVNLLDAHIDAIRAVVRDQIQTDDHPVGRTLAETLEARVQEHLAG